MVAVIVRQQCGTHVSAATDSDTTIEDTVFSMESAPRLYNEDQWQQSKSVFSCIISSCYLAVTSRSRITTEDFVCAVVILICRVYKSVRLL
jgi:hypothetical protein